MKVRCSGDTPRCTNCQRRNRPCNYAPKGTGASSSAAAPTNTARAEDASSAEQTEAQQAQTQAASTVSGSHHDSPSQASDDATAAAGQTAQPRTSSPTPQQVRSLVEEFFARLYPLPSFCFLHKETVIRRCVEKTIDESLKLAICAITAMMFGRHKEESANWAQEGERLILDRLDRPSIFTMQASLLIIRYRAGVGQFPRAFILAGLAARWAVAMRLNYEHSSLSPVAQEVRRRTFWSLYLLEDSFCVGLKEFELFDPEIIHLQLPCEDADFTQERPSTTGYLQPGRGLEPEVLGSRAAFVKLAFIRRGIMRYV